MQLETDTIIDKKEDEKQEDEFIEILDALRSPIPQELIKEKPIFSNKQKTGSVKFISWTTAIDILDHQAPFWSSKVENIFYSDTGVTVEVSITIRGIKRSNIATVKFAEPGYGSAEERATNRALKRAAAMFGLARSLYQHEDVVGILEAHENGEEPHASPAPAVTKDNPDLKLKMVEKYSLYLVPLNRACSDRVNDVDLSKINHSKLEQKKWIVSSIQTMIRAKEEKLSELFSKFKAQILKFEMSTQDYILIGKVLKENFDNEFSKEESGKPAGFK